MRAMRDAAHVQGEAEGLFGFEVRTGQEFGFGQCAGTLVGDGGAFEDGDLGFFNELTNVLKVVSCRLRQSAFFEPATGIGVAIMDQNKRIKPDLFAAGGEQEREIEAVAETLGEDVGRCATFWPVVSKLAGATM
jgi:hypothetical protein